ncbi:metalloregulator ArsR/SmtB family transcription factor [Iamia sp.]|uniref:ArsR/SmtB family transcription factor n=1 Tax=Iamia sp. TaxID=2722710 RepID=UPI002D01095F|nr:metalloregulator ArsR/SmtB family transcription factor [Iamia sp.]HXH59524.1 metalloregulator ArsR/SmtB family transcription factor [Iamia sp.]
MASLMGAFAASSRVRLLYGLHGTDRTVEELAAVSGLSPSLVSQQLRVLRLSRLVIGRRDGRHIRYRLHDEHVVELLAAVRAHTDHAEGSASADDARLSG